MHNVCVCVTPAQILWQHRREKAVTTDLQRVVRGHLGRQRVRRMLAARLAAAIRIQVKPLARLLRLAFSLMATRSPLWRATENVARLYSARRRGEDAAAAMGAASEAD